MIRESIIPNIKVVQTEDERLLCIDLSLEGKILRLINCYFPYYNGSNIDIYVNLLGKINCLFNEHENNHVIVMGDFNAHTTSVFGDELKDWCNQYGWSIADVFALPLTTKDH